MSAATTHTHMIDADALREAVGDFMIGFGSEPREIELVTNNLVEANLTGHDSHGIGMLPRYANAFLEGGLHANAHWQFVHVAPAPHSAPSSVWPSQSLSLQSQLSCEIGSPWQTSTPLTQLCTALH